MKNLGIRIIIYIWSVVLIIGAIKYHISINSLPTDFGDQFIIGALAWLGLIFDKQDVTDYFKIFIGLSMLLGPIIGTLVFYDLKLRIEGGLAVLSSGAATAILITGSLKFSSIGFMIGGIAAPLVLIIFIVGFILQQAKESAQKAMGIETDTEKYHQMRKNG